MKKQEKPKTQNLIKAVLPLGILSIYIMISRFEDLRIAVPEWIGLSAVIICLIVVGGYRLRSKSGWSAGFIIAMAAMYRLLFLFGAPELSDDIFRYVLDGRMLISGNNPYNSAPVHIIATHPALSNLSAMVNHGDLPTIYPPVAQLIFAIGAMAGGVFGMKLVLVVMDLLLCMVMAKLLERCDQPRSRLILYAWHPLPILEIAGSGHIDGAGLFFLFTAFLFLPSPFFKETNAPFKQHLIFEFLAGCFLAAAVMTKWLPLVFLPAVLLVTGVRQLKRIACGFFITILVMIGRFWPGIQNGFHTLFIYATNWEFSGFAFRMLRNFLDSGTSARLILASVFTLLAGGICFWCYRGMGGVSCGTHAHTKDLWGFQACYAVSVAFLLLTPTLHPWYALYLAAFLPFAAGPAGIVLSWSVFLGYRVVIGYAVTGQWMESDLTAGLVAAAPVAGCIASVFLKDRAFSYPCPRRWCLNTAADQRNSVSSLCFY